MDLGKKLRRIRIQPATTPIPKKEPVREPVVPTEEPVKTR